MATTKFSCPSCQQKLTAEPEALRIKMQCPRCASEFVPMSLLSKQHTLPAIPRTELPKPPTAVRADSAIAAVPAKPSAVAGQVRTILMEKPSAAAVQKGSAQAAAKPAVVPAAGARPSPAAVTPAGTPAPAAFSQPVTPPTAAAIPAAKPAAPAVSQPVAPPTAAAIPAAKPAAPTPSPVLAAISPPVVQTASATAAATPAPAEPTVSAAPLVSAMSLAPDATASAAPATIQGSNGNQASTAEVTDSPLAWKDVGEAGPSASKPSPAQPPAQRAATSAPARSRRAASIIEIRSVAKTLLDTRPKRLPRSIGYGHIAAAAGFFAAPALLLAGLSESTVLRTVGIILTAIAMLVMLAALAAARLMRWQPAMAVPESQAPAKAVDAGATLKSISPQARAMLVAGGLGMAVLATTVTWLLAAATRNLGRTSPELPPHYATMIPEEAPEQRADLKLRTDGHVPVSGGVLFVPPSFQSSDGAFDLVMHFHGNTELVKQSVEAAKVNAFVYIVNLGIGSGPYEERYMVPGIFDEALTRIAQAAHEKRGLRGAKLRRVALSAWSAGYGAVAKILESKKNVERVDAVLLMDGLHVAYMDQKAKTDLDLKRMEVFIRFAKEAAESKKLFSITHSQIKTTDYASTTETADALLHAIGLQRTQVTETPPKVDMPASMGVWAKGSEQWLRETSDAHVGSFRVRGYEGLTPENHMAHLIQMSVTVLPELVERWK